MKKISKALCVTTLALLVIGLLESNVAYAEYSVYTTNEPETFVVLDGEEIYGLYPEINVVESNGLARNNGWQFQNGHWFFLQNGVALRGWIPLGSNWYFTNPNPGVAGHLSSIPAGARRTGPITINGNHYFLNPAMSGRMVTRWHQINGHWYYFGANGRRRQNQWGQSSGNWYFLTANGRMRASRGWFVHNGQSYFTNANGRYLYTAIWHAWRDTDQWVGFWPAGVNVYTRTLGQSPNNTNFSAQIIEARRVWGQALGITIGTATSNNAQIRAFGGSRAEVERHRGYVAGTFNVAGRAYFAPRRSAGSITVNHTVRNVFEFSGQSDFVVVINEWNESLTRIVTIHELGHSLGFRGHSITGNDIMYATINNNTRSQLNTDETRHMRQIYATFR